VGGTVVGAGVAAVPQAAKNKVNSKAKDKNRFMFLFL
jgi:hypothetical protein